MSLIVYNCNWTSNRSVSGGGNTSAGSVANWESYHYLTLVLTPCNILANAFAIRVFSLPVWRQSCLSQLAKGLSVYEVLFQAFTFFYVASEHFRLEDWLVGNQLLSIVGVEAGLRCLTTGLVAMQLGRNWTIVSLAVYRFEALCRSTAPCSHGRVRSKWITQERIGTLFVVLTLAALLLALPRVWETQLVYCRWTQESHEEDFLATRDWYSYGYLVGVLFVFQSGGPVIIVLLLSIQVIKVIQQSRQFRQLSGMAPRRYSSDRLIIGLCVAFAVLESPVFLSKLLLQTGGPAPSTVLIVAIVANTCLHLDSSVNIVVYLVSNRTFRTAAVDLLCRRKRSPNEQNRFVNNASPRRFLRSPVLIHLAHVASNETS